MHAVHAVWCFPLNVLSVTFYIAGRWNTWVNIEGEHVICVIMDWHISACPLYLVRATWDTFLSYYLGLSAIMIGTWNIVAILYLESWSWWVESSLFKGNMRSIPQCLSLESLTQPRSPSQWSFWERWWLLLAGVPLEGNAYNRDAHLCLLCRHPWCRRGCTPVTQDLLYPASPPLVTHFSIHHWAVFPFHVSCLACPVLWSTWLSFPWVPSHLTLNPLHPQRLPESCHLQKPFLIDPTGITSSPFIT